jgi:bifunctional non-homologous end joining protein LigD
MSLDVYRRKRDFTRTPEPSGRVARRKSRELAFVIQKHAASHLHYDFRLELDGVLLSWAVPKGPSLDPKDRRLAMQTEDHPVEYGDFEGIIPPKQYGAGTVIVWDRGRWIPKEDPREGYRKGKLKFVLEGEKLHGGWTLVRSRGGKYGDRDGRSWLLIKENDGEARTGEEAMIVERKPDSVLTQRSLDEVAQAKSRVWHSTRSVAENIESGAVAPLGKRAKASPAGRRAPMPATMSAQLATLVDEAPPGFGWLHEIKYDGYRMLCRIERGRCQVWSRNGKEWTAAFPSIARAAAKLPVKNAWIDGEVVMPSPSGVTSFQELQNALGANREAELVYFAFDLMHLDGSDLRALPLVERKRLLEPLVAESDRIRFSGHFAADGATFLAEACRLGFEGIVSKREDSPYEAARTRGWLKVKCSKRQEFVIGAFTEGKGSREGFGALLLGYYDDGELRYCGKVGTGFDDKSLRTIRASLEKLRTDKPAFADPPKGAEGRRAIWVEPALVAEVAFTEWTRDGTLRHPSFQGLRLDKKPREVVRERAAHVDEQTPATSKRKSAAKTDENRIADVAITNPDKALFPEIGLTKRDLCLYYEALAPLMLPHFGGRPLSLVRCPNGWDRKCFFQKHAKDTVPDWVERIEVQDSDGPADYMMANDVRSLVTLAQLGVIELHVWGSKAPKTEHPDRLIFDLDPDDGLAWEAVRQAALLMRKLLEDFGLRSFLKTTGGKGLHVVVPIAPSLDWETAKDFTRGCATILAHTFPDRFTTSVSKSARKGRIFIDYLRNAHGATAIGPYSVRARENAPIAVPIEWSALDGEDIRFDRFNVRNSAALLKRSDPWRELPKLRQTVTAAMRKRVAEWR